MTENKQTAKNYTFKQLWNSLNRNQRRYAIARLEYTSKADAAIAVGMLPNTVYHWPAEVDTVVDMLFEQSQERAIDMLSSGLAKAVMVKLAGMDSEDERVRQDAASEIIDRIMGKAKQGFDISGDAAVTLKVVYDRATNTPETTP